MINCLLNDGDLRYFECMKINTIGICVLLFLLSYLPKPIVTLTVLTPINRSISKLLPSNDNCKKLLTHNFTSLCYTDTHEQIHCMVYKLTRFYLECTASCKCNGWVVGETK